MNHLNYQIVYYLEVQGDKHEMHENQLLVLLEPNFGAFVEVSDSDWGRGGSWLWSLWHGRSLDCDCCWECHVNGLFSFSSCKLSFFKDVCLRFSISSMISLFTEVCLPVSLSNLKYVTIQIIFIIGYNSFKIIYLISVYSCRGFKNRAKSTNFIENQELVS